jgi:hypothetical protein
MRLVIKRWYEPPSSGSTHHSYRTHALLELSDEEQELVTRYGLGEHVLTQAKYTVTTLADLIRGSNDFVMSVNVAMGNERALRDACANLPAIFDYCRSFGHELTVETF